MIDEFRRDQYLLDRTYTYSSYRCDMIASLKGPYLAFLW